MDRINAKELRRRYRQGERDFRGVDLSGESLRGINLTGIDLSEANLSKTDLRGTNFTRAQLVGTEFAYARTGSRRRWMVPIVVVALLVLGLTSLCLGIIVAGLFVVWLSPATDTFSIDNEVTNIITGVGGLVMLAISIFIYYRKGILTALGAFAVAVAVAVAFAAIGAVGGAGAGAGAGASTVAVTFALAGAVAVANSVAVAVAGAVAVAFASALALAWTVAVAVTFAESSSNAALIILLPSITVLFFLGVGFVVARRALAGDPRDRLIRDLAVGLTSFGGTRFNYANLTDAIFSHTVLKGAHFQTATLRRTCFHLSKKLHLSRAYATILANRTVLNLLVSLQPEKARPYSGLSLKGAYLEYANLADIDFTEADISDATLVHADLQRATLTKTQALGTNFTATNLTATCVEAWNIDNTTQLEAAICDHVYLLANQQERRPHTGNFAPGEFTKLFEEVLNTVDLIFREGIDWQAFLQTFKDVQAQHDEADLEIQSIENKGDGVMVVRLNADPVADKEAIHAAFTQGYKKALAEAEQRYKAELQAAKIDHQEEIIALYRERNADVKEIASLMAQKPITVEAKAVSESKAMEGNDSSQTIKIGGDFNADNSVVNFGTISGQVTNQINQLGAEQSELQDLLKQLQTAIETDADLSDTDKTDALEQVEKLAEAGKDPQENQSRAKRAIGVIKDITQGLTETNKLVDVCKTLLPAIGMVFAL